MYSFTFTFDTEVHLISVSLRRLHVGHFHFETQNIFTFTQIWLLDFIYNTGWIIIILIMLELINNVFYFLKTQNLGQNISSWVDKQQWK